MKPTHPTDLYLILDHDKRAEVVMASRLFTRWLIAIAVAGMLFGLWVGYMLFN